MTESLDVPARLADGRSAVDIIGEYVWACHLVGYQNPDLTLHAAQVRDWYASEDGLDLRALEADRAAMDAAATATDSARRLQEEQTDTLAAAWQGRGADASRAFLARHAEASVAAASAVREAADVLAALRDDLWQAVDAKVGAAMEIEGRRHTERAEWLAATRTVSTGAGDRAAASELIDQQVKPFVDNDIRAEWLAAMQKTMAAASAAFDDATSVLTGAPVTPFEVPGDLGPVWIPSPPGGPQVAEVAGTAPAAWTNPPPTAVAPGPAPATAPPAAVPAAPEPLAAPLPAAAVPAPAVPPTSAPPGMPPMPSAGELGGGLPGATGGLAGLGTQLADAIGGLLNGPDGALPDPAQLENEAIDEGPPGVDVEEPAVDDEEPADDDEVVDAEAADDEQSDEPDDLAETAETAESDESDDACAEEPVEETPVAEPEATNPPEPMPLPPVVEPPPSAEAIGAETPCEIAADELPQAGP